LPPRAIQRLGTLAFSQNTTVSSLDFSHDGKHLVSTGWDRIHIWDASNGKEVAYVYFDKPPFVRFGDRDDVLVGEAGGGPFLWDIGKRKLIYHSEAQYTTRRAFSNNAKWASIVESVTDPKTKKRSYQIVVCDLAKRQRFIIPIATKKSIDALAIASDGKRLATVSSKGFEMNTLEIWDVPSGKQIGQRTTSNYLKLGDFAKNGSTLYFQDGEDVFRWVYEKDKEPTQLGNAFDSGVGPVLSHDEKRLAWHADPDKIMVWDLENSKQIMLLPDKFSRAFAFSKDGNKLALAQGHGIAIWDLKKRELLTPPDRLNKAIMETSVSPDGPTVVTVDADGRMVRWSVKGKRKEEEALVQRGSFRFLRGQGAAIALVSHSKIEVRSLPDLKLGKTIELPEFAPFAGPRSTFECLAISQDGKNVAASVSTRQTGLVTETPKVTIRIYDPVTGSMQREIDDDLRGIGMIRFSPDGKGVLFRGERLLKQEKKFAFGTPRKDELIFRDFTTGKNRFVVEFKKGILYEALEFTKDGAEFVSLEGAGVMLRSAKTGMVVRPIHEDQKRRATALAISPKSGLAAIAIGDRPAVVEIWDLAKNKKLHTFEGGHRGAIRSLAFSDDEQLMVTGGDDTTALIWDFKGIVK
jgi:WD40 repeat protein